MANLRENAAWESGIYQLETTDPVVGGADGIANKQAIQLANRTSYLKEQISSLSSNLSRFARKDVTDTQEFNSNLLIGNTSLGPHEGGEIVFKAAPISGQGGVAIDVYAQNKGEQVMRFLQGKPSGGVAALTFPVVDGIVWSSGNMGVGSGLDADKLDGLDSSAFIRQTDRTLISEYAHAANGQTLPDGDYSSPDFWFSIKPGIYYAVSEKGRNKPAAYGLVEIVSNGEVSITWSYWGEVWKWYQTFGKNNSGWKKVVFGDVTPEARANSIVARDGNADFEARYVAATSFKSNANVDDARINAQSEIMFRDPSDKFLRPTSLAKFKEVINGVDFACQKDPNGYTKLPNGLILQWGTTTAVDVIFPIAFNKRLNVSLTSAENECEFAVAVVDEAKIENPSNTGFKIGVRRIAGTTPDWFKFYWFAIGY